MTRKSIYLIRLFAMSAMSIVTFSACANSSIETSVSPINLTEYAEDSMTRTGVISADELISRYKKFERSYQRYEDIDEEAQHLEKFKGMEIVAFFGLWCHDSQREIPRLIKLNELAGNPISSLKLVAYFLSAKLFR